MAAWPIEPRAGFTAFPNDVLARAVGRLTPEQLRLFLGLVYAAEYRRDGSVSPDGRWRIGWAQVLVSYDGLAAQYGMSRDAVRRALARFEGVALAMVGRVAPATPGAMAPATPPSVVDFGSWYGNRDAASATATPPAMAPAMAPATPPAPIQVQEPKKISPLACAREAPRAPAEIQRLAAERWPLTLELLDVLEKTCGFEASLPKDNATRSVVELAIRSATVPIAAERIRAVVEADRAAKLVTRPWLGFHLKTIQGNAETGSWRPSAPARRTHGDLGVELERWWDRLSREDCERFLAERKAIDPLLDERAPFPSTGTEHIAEVKALIERWKVQAESNHQRAAGGA